MPPSQPYDRIVLPQRGLLLEYGTFGWNVVGTIVVVAAAVQAGSVALAGLGFDLLPARPRKPKDKAAVEAGARFEQYYILGQLRNISFFSLAECNAAIATAIERMNHDRAVRDPQRPASYLPRVDQDIEGWRPPKQSSAACRRWIYRSGRGPV